MIGPSDFGHELDSLVRTVRESREKLNTEKADLLAQIDKGLVEKQEGILALIEMNLSHSNDIMLPVVQATLRAAQLQYNSAVLLTKSINLARRLEKLTWALIALTVVLAVGAAGEVVTWLYVPPPPIVKFAPPSPPLFGR